MSYWSLDKKSCLQYCRHFLVDNGVFHGKWQVAVLASQGPLHHVQLGQVHGAKGSCGTAGRHDGTPPSPPQP